DRQTRFVTYRKDTQSAATGGYRLCQIGKQIVLLIAVALLALSGWTDRAQAFSTSGSDQRESVDLGSNDSCTEGFSVSYAQDGSGTILSFWSINEILTVSGPNESPGYSVPGTGSNSDLRDALVNGAVACGLSDITLREVTLPDAGLEDETLVVLEMSAKDDNTDEYHIYRAEARADIPGDEPTIAVTPVVCHGHWQLESRALLR
ncbi:MAG: hypothetical protein ACR2O8_02955, partial [Rhizobiaceae bacterium]